MRTGVIAAGMLVLAATGNAEAACPTDDVKCLQETVQSLKTDLFRARTEIVSLMDELRVVRGRLDEMKMKGIRFAEQVDRDNDSVHSELISISAQIERLLAKW